jgi:GNAT superfamily N-acetyltransferase
MEKEFRGPVGLADETVGTDNAYVVIVIEPDRIWIRHIHVDTDERRAGIGTALLQLVEQRAIAADIPIIEGIFNPGGDAQAVRNFYLKNGYQIVWEYHAGLLTVVPVVRKELNLE